MSKQTGAVGAHNAKVMNRFDLTKRLVAKLKHEEAVVGGIGNANFDLWASGQRPQNFYMLGSMGLAIPIAFGVAIAQPQRHVIALEGDGSLLMQLGCLATVAMRAPKNLTMVVWDNGIYQITGGQPTASASAADLVAIARGSGIANSAWAADEDDFDRLVAAALHNGGPSLIAVRTLPSSCTPVSSSRNSSIRFFRQVISSRQCAEWRCRWRH
jgi:thiamine pyrophosphate-dependent acetolactate synthase large subunit-like protein